MSGATPPASVIGGEALAALEAVVGADQVIVDDAIRALRTRGKSTPDLLKARAGDLSDAPDVVVRPGRPGPDRGAPRVAVAHNLAVVPFGGGTSVTGGLVVAPRDGASPYAGVVSLDLVRMKALVAVDKDSMTATLEPGLRGPEAEALLAEHGLTLGHYPQSFEFATIGGFAATRSSRAVQRRLRPLRRAGRRAHRGHAVRHRSPSARPRPTPPAPTCASSSSAPRAPSGSSPRSPSGCASCLR